MRPGYTATRWLLQESSSASASSTIGEVTAPSTLPPESGSRLVRAFFFHEDLASDDESAEIEEQAQHIIWYHPASDPVQRRIKHVSLSRALISFTAREGAKLGQDSDGEPSLEVAYMKDNCHGFLQCEEGVWLVFVVARRLQEEERSKTSPIRALKAKFTSSPSWSQRKGGDWVDACSLKAAMRSTYDAFRLFHGSVYSVLQSTVRIDDIEITGLEIHHEIVAQLRRLRRASSSACINLLQVRRDSLTESTLANSLVERLPANRHRASTVSFPVSSTSALSPAEIELYEVLASEQRLVRSRLEQLKLASPLAQLKIGAGNFFSSYLHGLSIDHLHAFQDMRGIPRESNPSQSLSMQDITARVTKFLQAALGGVTFSPHSLVLRAGYLVSHTMSYKVAQTLYTHLRGLGLLRTTDKLLTSGLLCCDGTISNSSEVWAPILHEVDADIENNDNMKQSTDRYTAMILLHKSYSVIVLLPTSFLESRQNSAPEETTHEESEIAPSRRYFLGGNQTNISPTMTRKIGTALLSTLSPLLDSLPCPTMKSNPLRSHAAKTRRSLVYRVGESPVFETDDMHSHDEEASTIAHSFSQMRSLNVAAVDEMHAAFSMGVASEIGMRETLSKGNSWVIGQCTQQSARISGTKEHDDSSIPTDNSSANVCKNCNNTSTRGSAHRDVCSCDRHIDSKESIGVTEEFYAFVEAPINSVSDVKRVVTAMKQK